MDTEPWTSDAVGLVDSFRRRELHPSEFVDESLRRIQQSELNAICHLDVDGARDAAAAADVNLPFGGVPMVIKELEAVAGWPNTEASVPFAGRTWSFDSTQVTRLRRAGAVLAGQSTSPEFGGINATYSKIHGVSRNPWDPSRTPGGSSGGTAAAVAGGLVPIGSGSDGGGSIRIPAGFSGLFGLKPTYGRIPRGPEVRQEPMTVVVGCLSRSVRDTARWLDVCAGHDIRDTLSLPNPGGWESALDSYDLGGLRATVSLDLGTATIEPRMAVMLEEFATRLISEVGLVRREVAIAFPSSGWTWAISNNVGTAATLGDLYPDCADDLTREIASSMRIATERFSLEVAAKAENFRIEMNEAMARVFDETDFVFCATNPDVAFAAGGPMPLEVGELDLRTIMSPGRAVSNNGALTIPANLTGVPAVSIPAGFIDGLPVGLQVIAPHHREGALLDLARVAERINPWPLTAPLP